MADDASVKVAIEVATKAAEIALEKFRKETEKADNFWSIFKGNLAANFSYDGIKGALATIGEFGKKALEESIEAEQAIKNLSNALAISGQTSQVALQDLVAYADELQNTTTVSDDAALASMALLASLTTLDNEGIKQATSAAADLSATLGIDLAQATDMVIKGINGQVTAFQKQGIMVKKGYDEVSNFNNVLEALSKFQGNAQRTSETFGGALAKLENQQSNVYESIGDLITQNPIFIGGIQSVTEVLITLSSFLSKNRDDIILLGNSLAAGTAIYVTAQAAITGYALATGTATAATTALGIAARVAWAAITGPVGIAVSAIAGLGVALYALVKNWDDIKIATTGAMASALEYAAVAARLVSGDVADGLEAQAQGLRDNAAAWSAQQAATESATVAAEYADEQAAKSNELSKQSTLQKKAEREELEKFAEALVTQSKDYKAINEQKIADAEANAALEQQAIKNQLDLGLLDYYSYQEQRDAIDAEFRETRLGVEEENQEADNARLLAAREQGIISEKDFIQARDQLNAKYAQTKEKWNKEEIKSEKQKEQDLLKLQRTYGEAKLSATSTTFGAIADIAALGGEKQFKVAKAFNLAEAITAGILSVQKAAASAPPPFNIPPIVAATAASVANVARIAATKPSYQSGGVVGGFTGASLGTDNVAINARRGEMMLNATQQKNLFDMARNGGGDGQLAALLAENNALLRTVLNRDNSIVIDGREVMTVIRDQTRAGRTAV